MRARSGPLSSAQFWSLNALASLALSLFLVSVWISSGNRGLQSDIRARQQYINETVQLSRLNSQVIQALAELAVQTGDEEIGRLLTSQGIQFSAKPSAAVPVDDSTVGQGE